eukprot:CAMPEP_0169456838 /NCGR_PEP_ID=MMETSP1042-20121227/16561_1 /TAXON_ID=464988 /ORGANISM="Hemiselmis andersenii, Strain CCMP1180" /LENGTH=484 /DNA_ID=CAMNT_0009569077 /DNA_START=8 /DNA_END=1462 /DNA_ORIENTATION=+
MRSSATSAVLLSLLGACGAFHTPYRPEQSRHFDVTKSSTFSPITTKVFDLHYADGSHLKGFNGVDQVWLGDYKCTAPFGVITDCNSPDFNGVDGILGFGLPKAGQEGRELPTPILFAMTDQENKASNARDLTRKFSFFSTDTDAEVQLGGYDPATTVGEMWYTPCLSETDFIVGVTSVRFGHDFDNSKELLHFSEPGSSSYLPAIMDSGTSCLVMPGDTLGGKLTNVPFNDFTTLWEEGKSFWLEIGGRQWRVPFSSWFLARTNQTCVQPSPAGMQGLLVGDVFFRSFMVEFDMTQRERPIIGIAPLNTKYAPVGTSQLGTFELHHAPVSKLQLLRGEETMFPAEHTQRLTQVDQIPIFNKKGTQYFMDVGVGTPKQPFTVIFDTGSAVLGVFVVKHDLPMSIRAQLPDDVLSQNLALEQTGARSSGGLGALMGMLGYTHQGPILAGLAVVNLAAVAVVAALVRRRRARKVPLSAQVAGYDAHA